MDLTSIATATNQLTTLGGIIAVTPGDVIGYQPQNPIDSTEPLPPTLLFHYEAENSITIESDITDHYTEDNAAINDHIALRPEMIVVRGFIGELNDVVPKELQTIKTLADKLVPIGAFAPQLSATALNAYNQAYFIAQSAYKLGTTAVSTVKSLSGNDGAIQNKQQKAFTQFYGYWEKRALFTVQTPWAVFKNMAIKTLRAVQDAETATITDFEITFKQIRFAQTKIMVDGQGRTISQMAPLKNLGVGTTTISGESYASKFAAVV